MTGKTNDTFAMTWRRVLTDPALPRLQAAQASGASPDWSVRDGRISFGAGDGAAARTRLPGAELPVAEHQLLGREDDIDLLLEGLELHRTVTVTGPAGVGKTRLAIEVATELDAVLGDGAAWVDLSGTTDPALVAVDVAARLGVQQGSVRFFAAHDQPAEDRPFPERLAVMLRERQLLLVLDNCEHVREGCVALVEAIRLVCPEVHVLCTSRERLGAQGEWAHALRSLPVPPSPQTTVEEALASPAVTLFLERAHLEVATPLSDADLQLAVAICQRLEGVPYAIELAGAQAGMVPLQQILDRIEIRGGSGSAETMISWSYHLLPPAQQHLLRRLAVFRGGFEFEAAAQVCAGGGYARTRVRRTLRALMESPLLRRDAYHSPPRFALPETTREYATEQLLASREADRVRRRHRRWFLELSERMEPRLRGPEQVEALDLLELELDNIRAALDFDEPEDAADSLRIACALQQFWVLRGYVGEGRAHVRRALATTAPPQALHARGLAVASRLATFAGDFDAARREGEDARRLSRAAHDRDSEAASLQQLAIAAHQRGSLDQAELLARESLDLSRALGNDSLSVITLIRLGGIAESLGDFTLARNRYEEALDLAQIAEDTTALAYALCWLGQLSSYQDRPDETKELLEESLQLSRRLGYAQLTVLTLVSIGQAAYRRGDMTMAEKGYREAHDAVALLEDRTSLALCSAGLADVHVALGDVEEARYWLERQEHDDPIVGPVGRAALLASRAGLAWANGHTSRAVELHRRAVVRWQDIYRFARIPDHLEQLALIAFAGGQDRRAATLLSAATRLREDLCITVPEHTREKVDAAGRLLRLRESEAWHDGTRRAVHEAISAAGI